MIGRLFAPLAMKIAAGIGAALLIACFILWLSLAAEKRHARKVEKELAASNAMIEVQNASILALGEETKRRQAAAQTALREAKERSRGAETVARRIEAPRPLSGRCETPRDVMEAGL